MIKINYLNNLIQLKISIQRSYISEATFKFISPTNIYYLLFWSYLWVYFNPNLPLSSKNRKAFKFILKFEDNFYDSMHLRTMFPEHKYKPFKLLCELCQTIT